MCGGYTLRLDPSRVLKLKSFTPNTSWQPMYNARPGEHLPVVTIEKPQQLTLALWNYLPHWMKDSQGKGVINARAESLLEKPYFRTSFLRYRCVIPADGFFEWHKVGTTRNPYFFHRADDRPFLFAGLYDVLPHSKTIGFTIITTTPNTKVHSVHNRMPVILDDGQQDEWLSTKAKPQDLMLLLDPYPAEQMELFPISRLVNNARQKGPEVLERANLF